MSEPIKVKDGSQPWKFVVGGIVILLLILIYLSVGEKSAPLGQAIDLQISNSTGTTVTVGNVATEVLAANNGRVYFRLMNKATNTISCVLSSSTAGMVSGAGIVLNTSSSENSSFDSGESNINWFGAVNCIANVTGTLATFEK